MLLFTHPLPEVLNRDIWLLLPKAFLSIGKGLSKNTSNTRSEPAVKEILLVLDAEMNFIIEDLDPNHLFIDHQQVDRVQEALQARLAENVFKPTM